MSEVKPHDNTTTRPETATVPLSNTQQIRESEILRFREFSANLHENRPRIIAKVVRPPRIRSTEGP
jgi:hypothetical protein